MTLATCRKKVGEKIVTKESLSDICGNIKRQGEKIVLMSGCFDILHEGHLDGICDASEYGKLVIGINSDEFVRRLKGSNRPIRNQQERAYLMAGFSAVEFTTIFDDDYELIRYVRPDFYVASMTSHVKIWEDKDRVGLLDELGVEIVEFGPEKRNSTTGIIKIILNLRIEL